ncbi:MAG: ATP-binding protein [Nanoarchaeota archaeon]|nr:ATP-binding protein [Nanoarchaeota archaeon]
MYEIILGRDLGDKELFGDRGTIFLGKHYVTMGKTTSLSNKVMIDVVKPHVILIAGKRGGGKSYSMAVIAEGMAKMEPEIFKNIGVLMMDTMGIFWTTKYPNYRQDELLNDWGLKPEAFDNVVKVFMPFGHFDDLKGKGIPVDEKFSLRISEISDQEWVNVFNLKAVDPIAVVLTKAITRLMEDGKSFGFSEIFEIIEKDKDSSSEAKGAAKSLFVTAKSWGIFDKEGTPLKQLVVGGRISVLDLSPYAHTAGTYSIRALVVGLLSKMILTERMAARRIEELADIEKGWSFFEMDYGKKAEKSVPLVWIFIDEAHEFLPENASTPATAALIQLIREGRQPGISVVLATQQPGKIHSDVMTQSDIVISTRITSKLDIGALNAIMQSYLPGAISKFFDRLPARKGSAIVLDDKLEKMYPIQIRPRMSWHGGRETSALKEKRDLGKIIRGIGRIDKK